MHEETLSVAVCVKRDHQRNQLRMHSSRSQDAAIRIYDDTGKVIEVHRHKGDFVEL